MSNSNFNFQNDQGYNSRGNQNYEGFNQEFSYRSQNNDRDVEQSSSRSSTYTKYLELQIRMLKQTATLQGPSINSDEFSASQSCSSNSNQLGYIQSTPSSVRRLPVVAPQGPILSNELGKRGTAANTEPKFLVNFAGVRAECGYPNHKSKFNRTTIPCESNDLSEFR